MKAQRAVWGDTLTELAGTDDRIVVVDGDLATSTMAVTFANAHPERFIQAGIAEQNMVGIAFGMSTLGYRPWLSSFGVFLTNRALDQVRMLVSQTKAPVRLAASYSGLLNGASGKTHQDIEDLSVMRALPNMTVLAPADETEAVAVIRWAADHDGPVYLRIARDPVADVFDSTYEFTLGAPVLLRDGDGAGTADVTVVSTGVQTSRTVEAVAAVEADGRRVRHVHLPTIKPLDEDALWASLDGASEVVTVEEHSVVGGLGDVVAAVLAGHASGARLTKVGLADAWAESGSNDFLLDKYGLSAERVAGRIRDVLGERVPS
ncbi:transketolase C-terminal domain-containing protein [Curtobacterium sp. MCPF17_002]|uniref:transketolase family protein n=1 Tax=Curtobacterium sp. MCPF17_002 TaxID=2175645 RepID=UPI000DA7D717|nr:transketolase C-terminal domain-containing protein [Curtobacterium sp. MCPF17_002]WIB77716.1 transketolase C-terminal domain-containing protein [Curtobacterium sp. MCPF17_002]